LSGDSIATPQNIYYPVVLDNPTDDTTIAIGGLQGTGGGYGVFTYSGPTVTQDLAGLLTLNVQILRIMTPYLSLKYVN
jgi:hypothetical protein